MDVQVRDGFAAVRPVVDHHSISRLENSQLLRHDLRSEQETAQKFSVPSNSRSDSRDQPLRDYQHMHRRLGRNVVKSDPFVRFGHHTRRDLTRNDFFKNAHPRHSPPISALFHTPFLSL
ncbi:MAG: hypothetical protein RLZZ399_1756 [Verrucomicrobiota bacterium]